MIREAIYEPERCPHCGAPAAPLLIVAHIQATVAAYYKIDVRYMKSDQRGFDVAHPRQVAMFLAAELTPKSLPAIGRCFNRDHTTVMYAVRAVRKRLETDPEVAMDIGYLRGRLTPENSTISKTGNPIEQTMKTQAESTAA